MHEVWFQRQQDFHNDSFHSDFEKFIILKTCSAESSGSATRLGDHDLIPRLMTVNENGGLKLLLTRHRLHLHHEFKPEYMAFDKSTFNQIARVLKIPSAYLYIRSNLGGSGAFQKYSTLNDDGSVSRLSFVIRVPHSPRPDAKAVWSLAVSWDVNTAATTALLESVSDFDMRDIEEYIDAEASNMGNPLFLPTMLLDLLVAFYIEHRKELQLSLFSLESQLGITRGVRFTDAWSWDLDLHREITKHGDVVFTGLVYLQRRLEFALGLSAFILESLDYCKEEGILEVVKSPRLTITSKLLRIKVCNNRDIAKVQLDQVLCLQKRCQALTTVLTTVINQQDSRTNTKIAQAAKQDSTSMTALTLLGVAFLPASLVASLFSTSMFNFWPNDTASSNSKTYLVTPYFWIYWVVTIPLTLSVIVIGKYWMMLQSRKVGKERLSLKMERMVVGQNRYTGEVSAVTPIYPKRVMTSSHLQDRIRKTNDVVLF